MNKRIPISYGEFHDVPRMIRCQVNGKYFFLRSYFNEHDDDYSEFYDVYLLPFDSESDFDANPTYFTQLEQFRHLGKIAIKQTGLDRTCRESIDAEAFCSWLADKNWRLL